MERYGTVAFIGTFSLPDAFLAIVLVYLKGGPCLCARRHVSHESEETNKNR
jgi:hypothetical protein